MDLFEDYHQVGYRGLHKRFNVAGSVIHTIRKMEPREFHSISELSEDAASPPVCGGGGSDLQPLYPPRHTHHLSFWLPGQEVKLEDSLLEAVVRQTRLVEILLSWRTLELFTSQDGRHSQTLQLEFCDTSRPLGHSRTLHLLVNILGKSLEACAGVLLR